MSLLAGLAIAMWILCSVSFYRGIYNYETKWRKHKQKWKRQDRLIAITISFLGPIGLIFFVFNILIEYAEGKIEIDWLDEEVKW